VNRAKAVITHTLPNGPFGQGSSENKLDQARESFAKGDFEAAISGYTAYIKKHPGNADAHGELGNVYYSAGKLIEAAHAYYDAGIILIEQKQFEKASGILPPLARLNSSLANDLSSNISQIRLSNKSGLFQTTVKQELFTSPPQSALQRY
jgi:TolA-binding protein